MIKLKSDKMEDRENVAFTLANFIVGMTKTLGFDGKTYIQHLCGNGIPSDMEKVRDQIFTLKLMKTN